MLKPTEYLIGQFLRLGLWLSVSIVLVGGIIYLMQSGAETVHYQDFAANNALTQLFNSSSLAITLINVGFFTLVMTQILRVALVFWLFFAKRELAFVMMSGFIFIVLIYSLFVHG